MNGWGEKLAGGMGGGTGMRAGGVYNRNEAGEGEKQNGVEDERKD